MTDTRDVNFRIRGTDQSGPAFKGAKKNIDEVTGALKGQAKAAEAAADAAAENYTAVNKALETAQEKAFNARKAFDAFSASLAGNVEPSRKQTREFESLGKAADRADKDVLKLQERLQKAEAGFNTKFSIFESVLGSEAERAKMERASLGLATTLEQAQAAQERLAKLNAFRQIGEDAEISAGRLRTFGAATAGVETATQGIASSLRAIIDPAGASRASLAGLEEEVTRVVAVIGNADKPVRNYQDALIDLGRIQSDLLRQGAAVEAYQQQKVAVEQATAAFHNAQDDVRRYADAIKTAEAPNEALVINLRQAEAALAASGHELDQQQAKLLKLKAPLDAAKISVDNLANAETRLKTAATNTAVASEKLGKAFSGQNNATGRFLGLKPFELQNLSFQINDIFTQIASGTSVMQTFAQQGGQIVQIFPQLLTGALKFLPVIALLAPPIIAVALALKRVYDLRGAAEDFSGALALNSDRLAFNAEALASSAIALGDYGVKLGDAKKALQTFLDAGVDSSRLVEFTKTAQDLSDALGIKLPDAVNKVRDAFTGNFEDVQKLDKELNFLTASEYEHIDALFESGDAEGARTEAFRIFKAEAQDGAEKSRGPWADATRQFGAAWNDFLNILSNSAPITDAVNNLTKLINFAKEATRVLARIAKEGDEARKRLETEDKARQAKLPRTPDKIIGDFVTNKLFGPKKPVKPVAAPAPPVFAQSDSEAQRKAVDRLAKAYDNAHGGALKLSNEQRLQIAREKALSAAAKEHLNNFNTERVVQIALAAEQQKIDADNAKSAEASGRKREAASRKAAAAAKREQNEIEAAIRKRESLENQIVNAAASLAAKAGRSQSDDLEAQTNAIELDYQRMGKAIDDFAIKYGKNAIINGKSLDIIRQQANAQKELLKQQATMQFYDKNLRQLEGQRADEFQRIADAQDAGKLSSIEAFEAARAQQEILGPQIAKMAQDAINWAKAISGAEPSPQMKAFIAQQEKVRDDATRKGPKSDLGAFGVEQLNRANGALNSTLAARNELISATNDLFKAGLIGASEAEARIKEAVDNTTPSIQAQSKEILTLATKLHDAGLLGDQAFSAISAKLKLVAVSARTLETPVTAIRQQLEQMFASGVLNVFDAAAQSFAGLVDGTLSWGDAIRGVWDAFRSFAADFLRQIAMMILQQAIFNALKAAADSSGGGIFSSFAKLVVGSKHTGGLGGDLSGVRRRVDPTLFLNAPRYHGGTSGIGLSADEQAVIVQKNEEILTSDNPRHIKNWTGGGNVPQAAPQDVKIINTFDPGDFMSKALASRQGQKAILNFMRANPGAVGSTRGSNN